VAGGGKSDAKKKGPIPRNGQATVLQQRRKGIVQEGMGGKKKPQAVLAAGSCRGKGGDQSSIEGLRVGKVASVPTKETTAAEAKGEGNEKVCSRCIHGVGTVTCLLEGEGMRSKAKANHTKYAAAKPLT